MIKKLYYDFLIIPIFRIFDFFISKNDNYWAFCVHHIKSNQFIENQRAMFEEVKKDEKIRKIIFTRDDFKDFNLEEYTNTTIVKIHSLKGLYLLSQCKVIFLTHSISMDLSIRYGNKLFSIIKPRLSNRIIVNLWHGIPLKRLLALTNENVQKITNRVSYNRIERAFYSGLIASSDIDSYAMATMFYPIKYKNIWLTGLPRNDFLLKPKNELPKYISKDIDKLEELKKDKKLILYAPTYRQSHVLEDCEYYQFTALEIENLRNLLLKNNAILGFRMHYFRNSNALFNLEDFIDNELFFDLGHNTINEISAAISCSDIVITDYSSVYIDALYVNKAVFSFAYDLENYKNNQDGILYDLELVFPSKVITQFDNLLENLESELNSNSQIHSQKYEDTKKIFFKYLDNSNSLRVVDKINQIIKGDQ
ncbi:CDP-glycerol glycerophosphotransferase family protein [Aliarcobacter skirrowii]|uniref:CDP-glycerol glycerophosphotransferase family protein n=1 Tax=Aliarcobacter skirrowii TaxID=28200 RepID=UPI0029AA5E59|nr:CDP-glycerol glycerophosphotransferase family protein [Aliarcobacter skirrowii]MDX4065631.1 CDP-glycerol glycerophosphotransferase family protein [Aliarcobacter skirrowii]